MIIKDEKEDNTTVVSQDGFIKNRFYENKAIDFSYLYLTDENFTVNVRVFDFSGAYNFVKQRILLPQIKTIYNHFHTFLTAKVLVK